MDNHIVDDSAPLSDGKPTHSFLRVSPTETKIGLDWNKCFRSVHLFLAGARPKIPKTDFALIVTVV